MTARHTDKGLVDATTTGAFGFFQTRLNRCRCIIDIDNHTFIDPTAGHHPNTENV
jgi:hypothetical protein